MTLLFVKVLLAPLIVLIASLLSRRFGPRAAGLFLGLPGTALPFLLTINVLYGVDRAVTAATGSITGQLVCTLFCVGYARTAARHSPVWAVGLALAVAATVGLATLVLRNATVTGAVALGCILAGLATWPAARCERSAYVDPAWTIPVRMGVVTLVVAGMATAEPLLGSVLAASLASLPVLVMVMGPTVHRANGPDAAVALAHGTLASIGGTVVFLLTVIFAAPQFGLAWAVALGFVLIPLVNEAVRRVGWRHGRRRQVALDASRLRASGLRARFAR